MINQIKKFKVILYITATYQSLLSNATFADVFLGLAVLSERKNMHLEGFEPQLKVKIRIRARGDLQLKH